MSSSDPDELFFIMKELEPALNSMDVRTIAISPNPEENWQNLITSIIIRDKSVDEIKKQQKKVPLLKQNKKIRLYLRAYPFDNQLFGEIMEGKLIFSTEYGKEKVVIRKIDLTRLKVISDQRKIAGSCKWILEATSNRAKEERRDLWRIANENEILARGQAFPNISKLIENRLGIQYNNGSEKDINVIIPPLASIEKLCFSKTRFSVEIKRVKGLKNLQLNLSHTRGNDSLKIETRKVKEENHSLEDVLRTIETFELENALPYDQITVELILEDSTLRLDSTWDFVPLENVVEPFLKTLNGFCSLEKLKLMVLEPELYGKPPGKIFEMAITWLLSLSGYSTIPLWYKIKRKTETGEFKDETFEKLINDVGFEIGSVDIIAYEENKRILLIDCSITSPDENKIGHMLDMGKHLSTLWGKYRQFEMIPVLVSSKKYDGQPRKGLSIVDKKSLNRILEELSKGNREKARKIFCEFGFSFS